MRARYIIPFTRRIIIPDHWGIPIQGGICRVIEKEGVASALEVTFCGQPIALAPKFKEEKGHEIELALVNEDRNVSFIRVQLTDAMAFLSCYFDIGLNWDEVEAFYEAESPEEEGAIEVKSFKSSKHIPDLPIPFDLLAKAILCAESERGPNFEATLVATARDALGEQRYIDSFRYSFLLIESIYGGGKFKKDALKAALRGDEKFTRAVHQAMVGLKGFERLPIRNVASFLEGSGGVGGLIDHLVEQRGIYFHGNIRRKDAWRPDRQQDAHVLAIFSLLVAQEISQAAASPMYAREIVVRYLDIAKKAGATLVYKVKFNYRNAEENFVRSGEVEIKMPGTKPTPAAVIQVTKNFIRFFEENVPMGSLQSAECVIVGTGKNIFEMKFSID